jgi:hypothetical protein
MKSGNQSVAVERSGGGDDLLVGAAAIAEHLRTEGLDVSDGDVYYLVRSAKIAAGRFGKNLIASKSRISRDLHRAAKALTP